MRFKKLTAGLTAAMLLVSSNGLVAHQNHHHKAESKECCHTPEEKACDHDTFEPGFGYQESSCASNMAPAIAIATIVAVTIVAIMINNNSCGHH